MESNYQFRGKHFFLTYPQCDLDPEHMLAVLSDAFNSEGAKVDKYIIAKEKHQDGNDHRHCYLLLESEFRRKLRASFLDIDGFHPNIEHVRSGKAVSKYCKKEGDFISNMKDQVIKKTRADIAKELLEGRALKELTEENPGLLFGYARLKQDYQTYLLDKEKPKALDNACGIWIAGPSGCGKTTIATTKFGNYYIKDKTKWWNGYNGEPTVVADDVDLSWKDVFSYFKWWADKFPFKGETKGGMVELRPTKFVVTSNRTIEELLALAGWPADDYIPYTRRFREYWITKPEDWEEQL